MKRLYRWPWIVVASVLIHLMALPLLIIQPVIWPSVTLLIILNHLVLTILGLIPRSTFLGPNRVRVPQGPEDSVYLTFDDGPNPHVTPRVLDVLDRYNAKATFFVIGKFVRQHPELIREIVRRGHAIGNHSDEHRFNFAMHSIRGYREEIERAQQSIFDAVRQRPLYFRAPFGFRSPLLEPALCEAGLELISWTRRGFDTRCKSPEKVIDRLTRNLSGGDILLLHDGPYGHPLEEGGIMVLEVLPKLLELLEERGLRSISLTNLPLRTSRQVNEFPLD